MKLRTLIIGAIILLMLAVGGIVIYMLLAEPETGPGEAGASSFSVLESGTGADYAYAVFSYRGKGNITLISLDAEPKKQVFVINDSQAIQAGRLAELVEQLSVLESYGYKVTVTDEPKIGNDVYVVPTGAIPSYALFNLQQNSSNGTIIYIGSKDLLLSSGIKETRWYDSLSLQQKKRIVQYDGTLDDFLDAGNVSLSREILMSSWMDRNITRRQLEGSGISSASVKLGQTGYMRVIYEFSDISGFYDSAYLRAPSQYLIPSPQQIYPWQSSSLKFELGKTNGTAFLTIKKDGKVIEHEQLRRVTDANVFIKKLEYEDPGEYVVIVDDNSGVLASGLLHISDIQVNLLQRQAFTYVFSVIVDGQPLDGAEAMVSVGNGTAKKIYINDGTLSVPANLRKGTNTFNIEIADASIPVVVENEQDPIIEFYLKYGFLSLLLVAVVYSGARISRKPVYSLRFGDSTDSVRQEMILPLERALESFKKIRKDMDLGSSPITPQELTVSLKRYLTNGADITEGNMEEILKKLVTSGHLECHRDYYQFRGEGDVKRNALKRIVREKLIESGTMFKEKGDKFITKDFEIGFFGEVFTGKAIVIVDDKAEERRIIESLSPSDRSRLRIMQANDMLTFVPIDRLSDAL
ncbi:hypothetical protein H0O00_01815 [Candidatus Micrarchaeota archaeon]|nr:hypothetical protein [Candidatus Micrarchaeota archaeon]